MWLKTLEKWLNYKAPASDARCEEASRVERELNQAELRKIEEVLRNFDLSPRPPQPASRERELYP